MSESSHSVSVGNSYGSLASTVSPLRIPTYMILRMRMVAHGLPLTPSIPWLSDVVMLRLYVCLTARMVGRLALLPWASFMDQSRPSLSIQSYPHRYESVLNELRLVTVT